MSSYKLYLGFFSLIVHLSTVCGDGIKKSSLAFVIDDTASMWDEISQVKDEANEIFDTVLRANASQIENFILVTFNDPDAQLLTITKNRDEFKRALATISVHGGGDCPEYAMEGIELALMNSLPFSYLYVFTDASAKDHHRFEHIKGLSQKQQSQIVFVLTGECGSESDADYQVYHQIAEATSGQVFHMMKDDVKDILKYVEETITGRGEVLVSKTLSPGYGKGIKYVVDSHSGDVLISVTGKDPKIGEVTGPGGSKPNKEHLFPDKKEIAIVKVTGAKPGEHEVEVGSKSKTHAVITAKTSINVELGFSTFKPSSIKDTATRPAPDGNTFLSVKLIGDGIKLEVAKILDLSDNVIAEIPLELEDETEQFYVTAPFDPPTTLFRVSVSGYDVKTKTPITRRSPTPVERQKPTMEATKNIAPQITIDGEPKIVTEYGGPMQLKCKVRGYPKPDIIWEEKDTGTTLPAKVSIIEVPYDYISILDIEKATSNTTYQCKASNYLGVSVKYIVVEAQRKIYFDVIETPKGANIEYDKEGSLVCKVDAFPPASITWYKNGRMLTSDANIQFSSDMAILTIKHMQPDLQGKYTCEARNEYERKVYYSNVFIFGLEKPLIAKELEEIRVKEGKNYELSCRIIKGIPKPTIRWSYRREHDEKFTDLRDTTEVIKLNNVRKDQAGSYKCMAYNIVGSDRFTIELRVEYGPKIKDDVKMLRAKDGSEVVIKCEADGEPTPVVQWFFNGTKLTNTAKTRIAGDNRLKLQATVADTGYYTCEAENELGIARKITFVDIFVPVNIEIPKASTIESMVGKNVMLPCRADGFPIPKISWTFYSTDPKVPPKDITPTDGSVSLNLRKVQLDQQGYYTCVADNGVGGSANITYELQVYAPPIIENIYPNKVFEAVEGDLVLRIQCKTTGSPKPTIIWKKKDLNLAFGSEWYDMEEDGTLVIKNIDYASQGTYVCHAENKLGSDTEAYDVIVNKSPKPSRPTSMFVEEGKSVDLKCDISHKSTDLLRWYKDGSYLTTGELKLNKVTRSDDGLYTCRVSDFARARSASTKLQVGFKPTFVSDEEENIEFSHEALVLLICEAVGVPPPKVYWKHNGKGISKKEFMYPLEMKLGETGIYECDVTNDFGTIHRSFNISSRDCIFNLKKDFREKQPLMISPSLTWPTFKVTEGYMLVPNSEYFFLNCPTTISNFPSSKNVMAFCEGDTKIKINGLTYNFADIQCHENVKPETVRTGISCLPGKTEYIQVGYRLYDKFLKVYEVCLDMDRNVTLFTKHQLSSDHTDSSVGSEWVGNDLVPYDFDTMYDCNYQVDDISAPLGRELRTRQSCCFARRQLVSSHDLRPGIPTTASFSYLNVIPHWSTCNSKNWEDVEKRVRELAISAGRDLTVTTGTAKPLRFPRSAADVSLRDGRGGSLPVAEYLWKVVQDPPSSASLAIIQVNVPELSPTEAPRHVLCRDICGLVEWMKSTNWKNVEDGFAYCCTISEFEMAFGYPGRFSPGMNKVLFDAYLIPEYYLSK